MECELVGLIGKVWQFLDADPDIWDQVAKGEAVIVNEQLARRNNLWVSDEVDVAPGLNLRIAAVVGDYGNPQGQVVMGELLFRKLYPNAVATSFGIRTMDTVNLRKAIQADLEVPDSGIINQARLKVCH